LKSTIFTKRRKRFLNRTNAIYITNDCLFFGCFLPLGSSSIIFIADFNLKEKTIYDWNRNDLLRKSQTYRFRPPPKNTTVPDAFFNPNDNVLSNALTKPSSPQRIGVINPLYTKFTFIKKKKTFLFYFFLWFIEIFHKLINRSAQQFINVICLLIRLIS